MKPLLTIAFIFFLVPVVSGQTSFYSESWRQKVFLEICNDGIENLYLGCADCISKPRLKADSLFLRISLDTALIYVKNESYTVKYYSFLRILNFDDSLAFDYLKNHATDTTELGIRGACMSRAVRFNDLIASEYGRFIYYKYKGQSFTIDGRSYWFDKPDRKTGKYKAKELKKLIALHGLKIQA